MGMFEFRLTPDGGETVDLSAGMRDVRLWEKTHKGRGLGMLRDEAGVSATVLYEIGFTAAKRQRLLPEGLTEDAFAETYELDVEDPAQRAARYRAEVLKQRIVDAELPDEQEEPNESDPTP